MYTLKQPESGPRKTISRKKQQELERIGGTSSRPSSRPTSRMGSRVNSDNEDSDQDLDVYDDELEGSPKNADLPWETQLKDAIEELNEKRASIREEVLARIQNIISLRFSADVLEAQRDDLMDLLKKSIKKGGYRECVLAANVISLVFITIGEDDEKMFTDIAPLLKYTIINHENSEVKAACIHCLGTACLISSTPQPSHLPTYELLGFFSEIVTTNGSSANAKLDSDTLTAALETFSVLYAALFQRLGPKQLTMQARRYFNNIISAAKHLLEHASVEVRVASGETIALMLEILNKYQRQRDDGEFSDDEEVQETYNEDDPEDFDEVTGDFRYDDINSLVTALGALSTDSSKHRNKKERSAGRSAFRDILKSVESQEQPTESLKLKDYDVEFDGWAILYSPGVGGGSSTFISGSRLAAAAISSQVGSRSGSRAGSRSSSSMGIYADAEEAKAEQPDRVDKKYLNAEMARMRQVQRKKERSRGRFEEY
ncbi:Interferon- developmental regulator 1 [Entomortierella beljakovae]|nr:Interferon- developmental regulator 1 [Entomortierella beljakovae]